MSTIKSLYVVHNFKKYYILGNLFTQETYYSEFLKTKQIFCYKFVSERYSIFPFFILFFKKKMKFFFRKRNSKFPRYDNSLHFDIFLSFYYHPLTNSSHLKISYTLTQGEAPSSIVQIIYDYFLLVGGDLKSPKLC